jgi:hypothetical protein
LLIPSMDRQAELRSKAGPVNYLLAWILVNSLGLFGAHRMYMGNRLAGILYLLTAGLLGSGDLYDDRTLNTQVDALKRQRERASSRSGAWFRHVRIAPRQLLRVARDLPGARRMWVTVGGAAHEGRGARISSPRATSPTSGGYTAVESAT